jgi:hypothetical protein
MQKRPGGSAECLIPKDVREIGSQSPKAARCGIADDAAAVVLTACDDAATVQTGAAVVLTLVCK